MNPGYGSQPVYQPQPNYSAPTPPSNPPPPSYNPYGNLPSGQVSLGTITYSGEDSSKPEPKKQNSSGVNMNVLQMGNLMDLSDLMQEINDNKKSSESKKQKEGNFSIRQK